MFEFLINLHKDDIKVLEYIQTRLNLGKINNFGNTSRLSVLDKSGILQVIDILTQYPRPAPHIPCRCGGVKNY